jgi:hypothetical protein
MEPPLFFWSSGVNQPVHAVDAEGGQTSPHGGQQIEIIQLRDFPDPVGIAGGL